MIKSIALQRDPEFPDGAIDRMTVYFNDDTSVTHVFGSKFKNESGFNFMLMLSKNLRITND